MTMPPGQSNFEVYPTAPETPTQYVRRLLHAFRVGHGLVDNGTRLELGLGRPISKGTLGLAIARYLNGLGPDHTERAEELPREVYELVERADRSTEPLSTAEELARGL